MLRSIDPPSKREHWKALDGIRGYGFLGIFFAHYLYSAIERSRSSPWGKSVYYVEQIVWMAVPAFFVLSGYLIGGILFNSRHREGFFRVFYGRRMLRILPVYYITLLTVACVSFARGVPLKVLFWSHFIYIQNLLHGYPSSQLEPYSRIVHLWSLAVEEQFYLTAPIVVWLVRDRIKLLKIIGFFCGLSCILRIVSPWIHISEYRAYFATPTRVDSILLGTALALVADHPTFKRWQPLAKYAVVIGTALWLISFSTHANVPNNYYRIAIECPLANFTVLALLVAILEKDSLFARICSVRWACWLGTMSYGLYVYHFTYLQWFSDPCKPMLSRYMAQPWDDLATALCALAFTILLGMFSYKFIERPAMSLHSRLKYGPALDTKPLQKKETVLSLTPARR